MIDLLKNIPLYFLIPLFIIIPVIIILLAKILKVEISIGPIKTKPHKSEYDPKVDLFKKIGINDFYSGQDEMNMSNIWDNIFLNRVKEFDILGHTNRAIEKRESELLNCIYHNGKIRIIVLNPLHGFHQQFFETAKLIEWKNYQNDISSLSISDIVKLQQKIMKTVDYVLKLKNYVRPEKSKNIQIRFAQSTIYHNITRADKKMCVSHYLSGLKEQALNAPSIILDDLNSNNRDISVLFQKHKNEFDNLWKESISIEDYYNLKNSLSNIKKFFYPLMQAYEAYLYNRSSKIPFPVFAIIFPTYSCQHSTRERQCSYCTYSGFGNQHIPIDRFEKIVRFLCLASQGPKVKMLEISGGGEPLDHPNFDKLLDILINIKKARTDLELGLLTNGLNFDKNIVAKFGIFSYVRINIPEDYYEYNSDDDLWKKYISNIKILRDNRVQETSLPTRIGIKLLVTKKNIDKIQYLVNYFYTKIGVDHIKIKAVRSNSLRPNKDNLNELADSISVERSLHNYDDLVIDFANAKISDTHNCWISPIMTVVDPYCNTYKCCNISKHNPNPSIVMENLKYDNYRNYEKRWKSEEHLFKIKNLDVRNVCNLNNVADCRFFSYQNIIESIISPIANI